MSQTDRHTDRHRDSMTESAQWANSVKICYQDKFLSQVFGYPHIQIIRVEFLQRRGHQIRVNTWTGSYERKRAHLYVLL